MKNKKLTFIESIMLVAGAGIGTGILTIPYAASKIGLIGILVAILVAYAISLVTYLYIADLTLNSKDSTQLLGILKEHLFRGKYKKVLTNVFFAIFIVILLQNLIVYIMSATDVICYLFNLEGSVSKIVFYIVASILILFAFLAKTTGTPKYCAAIQAIPIPDASIVSIFVIFFPAKRFFHSFPISLKSSVSI